MKKIKTMLSLTTLLVGASLLLLASCKGKPDAGTNTFDIEYIKVWEETVNKQNAVTVAAGKGKTVVVKVRNCNDFELDANGVLASAIEGKAETLSVNFEKGESLLTIVLKSKGFQDKTVRVAVTRKDKTKEFRVKMKRDANAVELNVSKGGTMKTNGSDAEVIVEADYVMTEVKIGSGTVTLASDGKKASATVPVGKVDITVKFAEYEADPFSFSIEKVTGNLPITCADLRFYIGDVFKEPQKESLAFDAKNLATWSTQGEEGKLQYSLVKVEMDFDADISSVDVKCQDERVSDFGSDNTPIEDIYGRFSGRVVKRMTVETKGSGENAIDRVVPVELKNINDADKKKYTEYFILTAGTATYTLTFKATGREDATYTIKLENPITVDKDGKITSGMTQLPYSENGFQVKTFDYMGANGMHANGGVFMLLSCYSQAPAIKDGKFQFDSFKKIETMGDLRFILERSGAESSADEDGDIYFYSNVYEDKTEDKNKKEFVRWEYASSTFKGIKYESITPILQANGKYVDGFIGLKNNLPQSLCFLYNNNKVTALNEHGFMARALNLQGGKLYFSQSQMIQSYRHQAVYAGKVKTANSGNTESITFAKNMTFKDWVSAGVHKTGPQQQGGGKITCLDKEDIMAFYQCYTPESTSGDYPKVSFTIKRGNDKDSCNTDCSCPPKDAFPVKLITGDVAFFPGLAKPTGDQRPDITKAFHFKEKEDGASTNNVYKVEMEVEVSAGTKEKYIYILDYRNNIENVEIASGGYPDYSADLFGLPFSSSAFEEEPMMVREREVDMFSNLEWAF